MPFKDLSLLEVAVLREALKRLHIPKRAQTTIEGTLVALATDADEFTLAMATMPTERRKNVNATEQVITTLSKERMKQAREGLLSIPDDIWELALQRQLDESGK